jgi:hypothetical protein
MRPFPQPRSFGRPAAVSAVAGDDENNTGGRLEVCARDERMTRVALHYVALRRALTLNQP